ncbi:hypothetical protein Q4E40_00805 [Pontibacter sp. BT731]|uniref:hypothetical protein n=1 Tax=Pontibacter coccineus TaxID=3063328 RepID=UPI0026E34E13|nr:hypothetical protein [Pontibacter sp. BT731]MDO6388643.1 hypothetical protein [Pontibacter sp. BT731]
MKRYLMILTSTILTNLVFQNISFGQEISSNLTVKEQRLLDSLLTNKKTDFSFKDKKVAFISGHSGTDINHKDYFLKTFIFDYLDKGIDPVISYRVLNEQERLTANGYDIIVMQVPKIYTSRQHKANLKKLAKLEPKK